VREICTPGSAWGGEFKKSCRLGEGTDVKALHPTKTKIVYCKDDDRRGTYPHEKFDYLGYTFRARRSKNRLGRYFINFSPGVSNAATV
jgi:hypothetical protein